MNVSDITILCVGDVMLDRFIHCDMERISPEAPVPVLRTRYAHEMPGGAGNVASNIVSLGGRAVLTALVGRDEPGRSLRAILAERPGIVDNLIETRHRPTICKTRFIAANQQVVRADEESQLPQTPEEAASLAAAALAWIGQVNAVILADYGKGVLHASTIRALMDAAREAGIPVFVDPKQRDFSRYRGAACITPNLRELAAASNLPVGTEAEVVLAARQVLPQTDADAILATRSEKGMMLIEKGGGVHHVAARAREVFDVSGAGDTVVAAMALCHAAGQPLPQAMRVANAAASVVVSKLGTATVTMAEAMRELATDDGDASTAPEAGVQSWERAQALVQSWKRRGLAVGFANGCFDILHRGHVALLAHARASCDKLVVALNSDASVRSLKGLTRPINPLSARAAVLSALRHVDCVVSFDEQTPLRLIQELLPDVLVKGADYTLDRVVGADFVRSAGGRIVLAPLLPGYSTTRLAARLREDALAESPVEQRSQLGDGARKLSLEATVAASLERSQAD